MKKFIITILFCNCFFALFAQSTFSKSIDLEGNANHGYALKVVEDGYIILAGTEYLTSTIKYANILKTDTEGELLWAKHYKNEFGDFVTHLAYSNVGIALMGNENIYLSGGITYADKNRDIFLMKADMFGDSIWMKTFGSDLDDFNATVMPHSDNSLLLYNMVKVSNNINDFVIRLIETDFEGNILWEKTYTGGYPNITLVDILLLDNGDFVLSYMTCEVPGICGLGDLKTLNVARFDSQGEEMWKQEIYSFYWENLNGQFPIMTALDDGGLIVAFYKDNLGEGYHSPPTLFWLDSLGNVVHEYDFLPDREKHIRHLYKTSSGTIIGVGLIDRGQDGYDYGGWVFAMSQEGELLWSRNIIDQRLPLTWGRFNAVQETQDGGLIITGFTIDTIAVNHSNFNQNIWLVKLDSMGCLEPDCADLQVLTGSTEPEIQDTAQPFRIFPNPLNGGTLYLECNPDHFIKEEFSLSIRDAIGRTLFKTRIQAGNISSLDVSFLQKGIYLISIEDENGQQLQMEKLVVAE